MCCPVVGERDGMVHSLHLLVSQLSCHKGKSMQTWPCILVRVISLLCLAVALGPHPIGAVTQTANCSIPPEDIDNNIMLLYLSPDDSFDLNRELLSAFTGQFTAGSFNVTGIITEGTGVESLDIQVADDVRDGSAKDMYTATFMQLYPSGAESQVEVGGDIFYRIPVASPYGVFLLFTMNPMSTALFPACYTETFTFQELETVPPHLQAVTHVDNPSGNDSLLLTFSEPLGAFALSSLSIGKISNCQLNATVSFTPGDQEVALTIRPGRLFDASACDLATLVQGNTMQLDAAATTDLADNPLSESNDSATYPGTGTAWQVEDSEAPPVAAVTELSEAARERYARALEMLLDTLQRRLAAEPALRTRLGRALRQRSARPLQAAAQLKALLQPHLEEFQRAVR